MGREAKFRKDLSMPGMVAEMRRCFERVEDGGVDPGGESVGLSDVGSGDLRAEVSVAAAVRPGRAGARRAEKKRRDGSVEYYHQSLCAVLVHPERRAVLPLVPPEPILKGGRGEEERLRAEAR